MKIIALLGDENTGKSHTINLAYAYLVRDNFQQIPGVFRQLGNPKHEDFLDILHKNGMKVGIIGMGDLVGELRRSLLYLEQQGCHSVICACRTKPNLEKVITNFPHHQFFRKTPSPSESLNRIVNVADARVLIAAI